MSESPAEGPQLEIQSDEDWKERVKEEDRQRDEQAAAEPDDGAAASSDPFAQLPRPDFSILVQMFATQAMTSLGLLSPPGAEKPQQQLPLARHFIDLLGVLQEKTRGNLSSNEEELLTTSLHELRLAYVEISRQASAPSTDAAAE